RRVLPSRECLPLARGRGRSSGWLKVTMSPVIPRPVGPTTDWKGSLTTTASLPRNRTHVRPYQVSSIAPILTQRRASPLYPRTEDGGLCGPRGLRGLGLFLELARGAFAPEALARLAV